MTLKNKSLRATAQARQTLAQRERMHQKKAIDEKVTKVRKQLEQEDDDWLKFLMEQRERELKEAEEAWRRARESENANKTPEQRSAEAKARQERDREREKRRGSSSMTSMSQSQSSHWNEYEKKWSTFDQLQVLTMAAVPWPPHAEKLLQWTIQKSPTEQQDYKSKVKSAYKKCALRWHPDKFMGKFGSKIAEGEKSAIHSRLNDNFQTLNASFTKLMKGT